MVPLCIEINRVIRLEYIFIRTMKCLIKNIKKKLMKIICILSLKKLLINIEFYHVEKSHIKYSIEYNYNVYIYLY